jgi:hypothetical protein
MPFACLVECSSIGTITSLAFFVAITRIGVNKKEPKEEERPSTEPGPAATAPAAETSSPSAENTPPRSPIALPDPVRNGYTGAGGHPRDCLPTPAPT